MTKTFRTLDKVLDLPLDIRELEKLDMEQHFSAILRAQTAATAQVMSAIVRVDEGRLKMRKGDAMAALLETIRKEAPKLKTIEAEYERITASSDPEASQ